MEEIGVEESETQREDEEARGSLKGKGYDAEMLSFYQQGLVIMPKSQKFKMIYDSVKANNSKPVSIVLSTVSCKPLWLSKACIMFR